MVYKKKSWKDKLADDKDLPKVVKITDKMRKLASCIFGIKP